MKKIGFIFPGQGSQTVGMGKSFYDASEVAREMTAALSDRLGTDMAKLMFEENPLLEQTRYTQPAILLVSAMAHRLFENEMAVKPAVALGHSLGEFSALVSVGALDPVDAGEVVHKRGTWMQEACEGKEAGMMVLLGLADAVAEEMAESARNEGKQVWAVNYNSDGQIVMAGNRADLGSMESAFKEAGAKRAMLLNMSVASHCPILEPAAAPLKEALACALREAFLAPVVSNVTAEKYQSKAEALELLPKQLMLPVKYKQSIQAVENEVDLFIEFGNGSVLKGINKKVTRKPTVSVSDMASLEAAFEEISKKGEE